MSKMNIRELTYELWKLDCIKENIRNIRMDIVKDYCERNPYSSRYSPDFFSKQSNDITYKNFLLHRYLYLNDDYLISLFNNNQFFEAYKKDVHDINKHPDETKIIYLLKNLQPDAYFVVGHDSINGGYYTYQNEIEDINKAKNFAEKLDKQRLSETGLDIKYPDGFIGFIDCIKIYKNFCEQDEEIIWSSNDIGNIKDLCKDTEQEL